MNFIFADNNFYFFGGASTSEKSCTIFGKRTPSISIFDNSVVRFLLYINDIIAVVLKRQFF